MQTSPPPSLKKLLFKYFKPSVHENAMLFLESVCLVAWDFFFFKFSTPSTSLPSYLSSSILILYFYMQTIQYLEKYGVAQPFILESINNPIGN